MRKELITSSGIKITIEQKSKNNKENFSKVCEQIKNHYECIEEKRTYWDLLFSMGFINSVFYDMESLVEIKYNIHNLN